VTERETLLAEIAERQARLAELDALDPLLIEAREIAARCSLFPARIARDYLGGEMDKGPLVTSVLAALRRGMEIAKAPPMGERQPRWPSYLQVEALARRVEGGVTNGVRLVAYDAAMEMAKLLYEQMTGEQP
jgi:hypothetical protein